MTTRLLIAALLTGLLLAPFAVAEEGGDDEVPTPDGCVDPLCIIPCWPVSTFSTGELIPPVWFSISPECILP